MFLPNHKAYIKSFYKKILSEASIFFDDRARLYIKNRARRAFKDYKTCEDIKRVKYKIREGRKHLHRLEKANRGHTKSALNILEEVYGVKGKTRHGLLYPYLNAHQPDNLKIQSEPFVPHAPRTAPPPELCPPLCALVTRHLGKKVEPELPVPQYKPLHVGRKANLLWKHRSMILDKVHLPLPFEILCELEAKAGAPESHPMACATLKTGGPQWDDFYAPIHPAVKLLEHLDPRVTIKPFDKDLIALRLNYRLPKSPYMTSKPSLLEYLCDEDEHSKDSVITDACYSPREKRRLYINLLRYIPCIDMFPANQLWKKGINYNVFTSNWAPKSVNRLLEDVPSEEVIQTTLDSSFPKKNKNNKTKK
ncbi:uncharacterized protein BX663DRAFT_495377 [Cokeromyces recurvatus]|uniref:uncharacterized protein n=1 Tax=Cokeromyces recurvatus TaxID=90255 RepID=UPI00221EFDC0|nr:uncharacterized protein BX663DRAFT_495377 [Cokeromyces recurvatus]KAI7907270.1 hypothetical protein BX663DRAFT_495377 [Cokeromyces recurvatus]